MTGVGQAAPITAIPQRLLARTGIGFGLLGLAATLLPRVAWIGEAADMAVLLALWGALGLGFARLARPIPEWRAFSAFFAALCLAGTGAGLAGPLRLSELIVLIVLGLLAQGILSVLFGLHISPRYRGWQSAVASGLCALGAGLFMIAGWPDRSARLVGLLLGVTFLTTALSLVRLSRSR
ncbi:hypothetical protein [Rhodovulum marinum]|uniref:Uncharacterized protein n=1 Tax=Rhodovulum marinum TaxID=320662 RepID=A0A4V2SQR6_9RHOB|nr:hypothetical protein [Rhodovulum marinum]TCP40026.1 hypothetical protein EV662_109152 [Rhodovulum marinum]